MKITTWNARDLNAPSKKRLLIQNLKLFDSNIIMLQETKLNKEKGIRLEKKLSRWNSYLQESRGASGGLGIIWNPRKVILNIIKSRHSWINNKIKGIKSNLQFILINVYGLIQNVD